MISSLQTYKSNQFDVTFSDPDSQIDFNSKIKISVNNITINSLTGSLVIDLYVTDNTLSVIQSLYVNKKIGIRYRLHSEQSTYILYDGIVRVKDIIINSSITNSSDLLARIICNFGADCNKFAV